MNVSNFPTCLDVAGFMITSGSDAHHLGSGFFTNGIALVLLITFVGERRLPGFLFYHLANVTHGEIFLIWLLSFWGLRHFTQNLQILKYYNVLTRKMSTRNRLSHPKKRQSKGDEELRKR